MKRQLLFGVISLIVLSGVVSGCGKVPATQAAITQLFPAITMTPTSTTTQTQVDISVTRQPTATPIEVTPTPQPATQRATSTAPGDYPPPQEQSTAASDAYPPPESGSGSVNATSTPANTSNFPQGFVTPTGMATPIGPTPTEQFPQPFGLNVIPSAGKVSIWHSWQGNRLEALMQIIKGYQEYFPEVVFDLTYVPQDDLLERYSQAAYNGGGPDLLLGSSDWRLSLSSQALVEDLTPYISTAFGETFNPVALETGQIQGAQACLPYELRGVLLYRNRKILPTASATFDQLVAAARKASGVGTLGAYFEGGSYFSLGHLSGLGGQLLDNQGNPLFDRDHYQVAVTWIGLLKEMKQAGALELNGDRDLQLFEAGKSGYLIEGSWNRDALAQAVGESNLVIDPWPSYQTGRLSGFVQSDCVYLNVNTEELSALDFQAALNFIGYFLTSPAQDRLAETGAIPALIDANPTDPLIRQVMHAFTGGIAYPAELDDLTRQVYFTALDSAISAAVEQGQDPMTALKLAFDAIQKRLTEIHKEKP